MSEGQNLWQRFIDSFDTALDQCIEDGMPKTLTIEVNNRTITIDIYETKASMKVMHDAVLNVAKKHRNMKAVK